RLHTDTDSLSRASADYGNLIRETPSAVLRPSSLDDILTLLEFSNNCSAPFHVSPRGRGHSVRGQAAAGGGAVVVDMASLGSPISVDASGGYVDVGGDRTWDEVLRAAVREGVAPGSWTDYLHLSVGGTLSNGGISGQSFRYGPQISNVLEMDVITGNGELVTCSPERNSDLFYAVLGGLGQFGIITRARIPVQPAPTRAKWVRLIYNDFRNFTKDQEHLISTTTNVPNYVEGSIITSHSPANNWRSSYYSPTQLSKIASLLRETPTGLLYSIEIVMYDGGDRDLESLLRNLDFVPGMAFVKDVGFVDFLSRVGNGAAEEEDVSHPWMNLFVPKSGLMEFYDGVFVDVIAAHRHATTTPFGPILFYPLRRNKWDDRMSAVTPPEEIFYALGLLHSSRGQREAAIFDRVNAKIMEFCNKRGIETKQYLPYYKSPANWAAHYGQKWEDFQRRKKTFDPNRILSPGHFIFNPRDEQEEGDVW
ncbi:hypothetical protein M569_04624, partial [Genlisea aurea]